jgi:hypothetical protein
MNNKTMSDLFFSFVIPDLGSRTMRERMKETVIATLNIRGEDMMKEFVFERGMGEWW